MPTFIPTEAQMESNALALYDRATEEMRVSGREWYPAAGRIAARFAADYFMTKEQAAGIIAAYSMNQGWKGNLTIAENYCAGFRGGLTQVIAECDRIMAGDDPAEVLMGKAGQDKRPCFYRNIIGRHTYVTNDRWNLRAVGCEGSPGLTPALSATVARAIRRAARQRGESAMAFQAIVWIVMRGTGE